MRLNETKNCNVFAHLERTVADEKNFCVSRSLLLVLCAFYFFICLSEVFDETQIKATHVCSAMAFLSLYCNA